MKHKWSIFWWNYGEEITVVLSAVLTFVLLFVLAGLGIGYFQSRSDQFNCNLERRPSIATSFWIDHSMYGYNPEGFCRKLKEKMEQE